MDKGRRNREKHYKPEKEQYQKLVDTILPPEGKQFIISPVLCLQTLQYIPEEVLQKVDGEKAIKELLFRQQNLYIQGDGLSYYESLLKQSFEKLDRLWLKRFNERLYKNRWTKSIESLRGIESPYSYRQAYFDKHPGEKYKSNHPLTSSRPFAPNVVKFKLSELEEIYMGALAEWEEYVQKQKGLLLQFYESFLEVINLLVTAKTL